jgi:hypothetical protein
VVIHPCSTPFYIAVNAFPPRNYVSDLHFSGNLFEDGRVLHVVYFQREELPFAAICALQMATDRAIATVAS